jgi:hypothetical protein
MVVPHYTYLVLKMPRPKGIITIKGSFELSDLCDREFHKMAQNFGTTASYAEKAKIMTTESIKLLEGRIMEPEAKKPRVEALGEDKGTGGEENTATS